MKSRLNVSLPVLLIAFAALAHFGSFQSAIPSVHAQEPAADASEKLTASLRDKIELAQIRLAIRLQMVEVAKAERQLMGPSTEGPVTMLDAKKQELRAVENELGRLKNLYSNNLVSSAKLEQAEAQRMAARAEIAAYESTIAGHADKVAVHDEKIKLLELRAKLCKAKLDQLKRQHNP